MFICGICVLKNHRILILVVLVVTLGILYLMFSVGRVSLRLTAFAGVAGLYTLFAIIRSLFVRIKDSEPGRPLPKEEAPGLWSLAAEVADRLETRPVEAIYITAGPEIAVTERGGLWQKLRGLGQRCLVVGLGANGGGVGLGGVAVRLSQAGQASANQAKQLLWPERFLDPGTT